MSDEQTPRQGDPTSWISYMPRTLKVVIGTVAGLSIAAAFVPMEALREILRFVTTPDGAVLAVTLGIGLACWLVYWNLSNGLEKCNAAHDRCERRTRQLTVCVLDLAAGNREAAIAEVRKLLNE